MLSSSAVKTDTQHLSTEESAEENDEMASVEIDQQKPNDQVEMD